MVALTDYAKIKNHYCICYFGYSDEYLVQLRLVMPFLERAFPGLKIHLGCKDDKTHFLQGCSDVLKISELKIRKKDFAYVREIRFNGNTHPVEDLLAEARVQNVVVTTESQVKTTKAVIFANGSYPTKSLTTIEIETLKKMAKSQGCEPEVDGSIEDAGMVMGVECAPLFEAAAKGIRTTLVPNGVGTRLYKMLFPNAIVMHN